MCVYVCVCCSHDVMQSVVQYGTHQIVPLAERVVVLYERDRQDGGYIAIMTTVEQEHLDKGERRKSDHQRKEE